MFKRTFLLAILGTLAFQQTAQAFIPFINRGNENIRFELSSNGSRPSYVTGTGDGTLTCERGLGYSRYGVLQPTFYQVIKFDKTIVDNQIRGQKNFDFRWGNMKSQTGRKGTIGKVKSKHSLNLYGTETFGVGFRATLYAIDGKFFSKQLTANRTETLAQLERDSFVYPTHHNAVVAKCPDLPRREKSALERQ